MVVYARTRTRCRCFIDCWLLVLWIDGELVSNGVPVLENKYIFFRCAGEPGINRAIAVYRSEFTYSNGPREPERDQKGNEKM